MLFIFDLYDVVLFVNEIGFDFSFMDNMLELLLVGGMDIICVMCLLVLFVWQNNLDMDLELCVFFDFNFMYMELWDGLVGIVMFDGCFVVCNFDCNGLCLVCYVIIKDKFIICVFEVGIWDYQFDEVVEKGCVGLGELMVIDICSGCILYLVEIDDDLKSCYLYKEWMEKNVC